MVRILLEQGFEGCARLTVPRDGGRSITPLHEAVRGQHPDVCRVLCEAAQSYLETSNILFYAARISSLNVCEVLINCGANVNVTDSNGSTPLHCAACYRDADFCKILIDAGADTTAMDNSGDTPLDLAMRMDNLLAIQLLLGNNADEFIDYNLGETVSEDERKCRCRCRCSIL